jgi:hypothetical protein
MQGGMGDSRVVFVGGTGKADDMKAPPHHARTGK